ncbi:hypothetical protein EOM81_05190, partial [bacterium]|nr:hypothetical protein [bacterium]
MSTTIDQKVVEMKFDNKQFESNVQTSMSTIEKLKNNLNFQGAGRGLEGINSAVRNVNMSVLSNAVETVHAKFSALEVMAITALANITNSVVNTGKKIISSLTIDPISMGFREYETQTNAIQTILANTQSRQKTVTKNATDSIKETTEQAAAAVKSANDSSVDDLRDAHQEKIKEIENLAEEELDVLEEKYEKESEALEEAIESETDSLKAAHKEKLALYHEEYMQKLKAVDEERYNRVKAIDDQIDSINDKTKAEEKDLKKKKQQERLAELQKRVSTAKDSEDRIEAEKRLSDYIEEINREQLLEQRKAKIDTLESRKDAIEEEYELVEQKIKEEYDTKTAEENELYEVTSKALQKDQEEREKLLRKTYQTDRDLLKEKQDAEKESILDVQEAELKSLKVRNDAALAYIKDQKAAASAPIETEFVEGSTLQDVNRALDELNEYADKTIYNFTEMTRNIGTFTAAGVDLDTSVQAIKGIANLAAVSGSNAQQASNAMYQLSQALSSGTVKLMDWNSVVNSGMGGQVFQDALKETARVSGVAIDDIIASSGSFRESLQNGWLTADILTETLAKFTGDLSAEQLKQKGYTDEQIVSIMKLGEMARNAATEVKTFTQLQDTLKEAAQSGWTKSWQIILGDFNEAKNLFTDISKIVGKILGDSADARNKFLSGGLSSGWKQFLNEGIADEEGLKESILEMTKESNPEIAELIKNGASLEATLKSGWMTSDILAKSVENLTSKTAGLSDEQLAELGYTRKQIDSLEKLNESIQNGSLSLDEFADKMKEPSGRENLIDAFMNSFKAVVNVGKMVKETFLEIFPPKTADQLYTFTEKIKEITEGILGFTTNISLKGLETPFGNLKRTLKGVFAILDIVVQLFKSFFKVISPLSDGLGTFAENILDVTASWGDWFVALDETIKKTDVFGKALQSIVDFVKMLIGKVSEMASKISPSFEIIHVFLERMHTRMSEIGDVAGTMKLGVVEAIKAIGDALTNSSFVKFLGAIWNLIKKVAGGIIKILGTLMGGLVDKLGDADFDGFIDIINGISIGAIALAISKFLNSFTKSFTSFKDMLDGVTGILDGVRGSLSAFQTQLKAGTLLKIAIAVGILAASILVLSLIDSDKLAQALGAITVLFTELVAAMAVFTKIGGSMKGAIKLTSMMLGISISVLILAAALKTVSDIEPDRLLGALVAIAGLMTMMIATAKILGSGGKTVIKGALQMILFAEAIKILASACKDFSTLDWEEIGKGLVGVGALMAEVSLFMNIGKFKAKGIGSAIGLIALAAAIKILASACKDFSTLKWEEIARGLAGMAGTLAAVTLALNFMPKNMVGIGLGFLAVSAGLLILASVMEKMGGMKWEEIEKGLLVLGSSLSLIALGLNAMQGTIGGSAALLIAVAALALLTPVLSVLGAMSWESIAKGLVVLAGAFTILGLAGLILGPILPAILGVAGAIALIGLGVALIGAGLLAAGFGLSALAVGITALAVAGASSATAFVAALTIIVTGIIGLFPIIAKQVAAGFVSFFEGIAEQSTAFGNAVKTVVLTLLDVLKECIPAIVDTALDLLISIFTSLVDKAPALVDLLYQFIISLIDGVARNLPGLIESVFNLFKALFVGVFEAFKGIDSESLVQGLAGIGLMAGIMAALAAMALLTPAAMLGVIGMAAVIAELSLMLAAVGALAQIPGLLWLIGEGAKLMEGIGLSLGSFIGGLVGGIMGGISSQFPQIGSDLSEFMINAAPFIEGAGKINSSTMNGVKALVETILLLTGANILNGLTSWFTGGSSMADFGKELAEFGPYFSKYYESIKNIKGPVVEASANAAKALSEMADNLPNTGGVSGWFFGENSISDFADELVLFGPKLKKYADSVSGLDSDVVINSTNGAKALSELAKNLPNTGGAISWFTGDNDIGTFGKNLSLFGAYFKEYYNSISSIKATQLSSVIKQVGELVKVADGMADVKPAGMTKFGEALKKLADAGITAFIKAFTDSAKDIKNAASEMLKTFTDEIEAKKKSFISTFTSLIKSVTDALVATEQKSKFKSAAQTLLGSFSDGVAEDKKSKTTHPITAFNTLVTNITTALEKRKKDFINVGSLLMSGLVSGADSNVILNPYTGKKDTDIETAFIWLLIKALNRMNKAYKDFYNCGVLLTSGFVAGIGSLAKMTEKAATALATKAEEAVRKALEVESPSKVFYEIGHYTALGFVNALNDYGDNVGLAGSELGNTATKGLSRAISKVSDIVENGLDGAPTIRPVLDLTEIQNGTNQLYGILNGANGYSISGSVGIARRISSGMNSEYGSRSDDLNPATVDFLKRAVQELTANPSKVFENTFNINGTNAKEIA